MPGFFAGYICQAKQHYMDPVSDDLSHTFRSQKTNFSPQTTPQSLCLYNQNSLHSQMANSQTEQVPIANHRNLYGLHLIFQQRKTSFWRSSAPSADITSQSVALLIAVLFSQPSNHNWVILQLDLCFFPKNLHISTFSGNILIFAIFLHHHG